jgi:hypothetical protein
MAEQNQMKVMLWWGVPAKKVFRVQTMVILLVYTILAQPNPREEVPDSYLEFHLGYSFALFLLAVYVLHYLLTGLNDIIQWYKKETVLICYSILLQWNKATIFQWPLRLLLKSQSNIRILTSLHGIFWVMNAFSYAKTAKKKAVHSFLDLELHIGNVEGGILSPKRTAGLLLLW